MGNAHGRMDEGADSIPHNLYANANQKKRGKPHDDAHAALADQGSQAVRKAITNVNANRDHCGGSAIAIPATRNSTCHVKYYA